MHSFAIIGGGFYGCAIALHLRRRGFADVCVVERERELLTRASFRNQARVHNGYHYPRSFLTAYRSRVNEPRFRRDYGFAYRNDFTALYAIAARRSNVTPNQYERFMRDIGAGFERAGAEQRALFDARMIASVYQVDEGAFDASKLREHFVRELAVAGVRVSTATEVCAITVDGERTALAALGAEGERTITADTVVNCTYANLNRNMPRSRPLTPLKHEITEIALVEVPPALAGVGITVMDGPFFSCMPFPAAGCHSLSHVRYTPHGHVVDRDGTRDVVAEMDRSPPASRADYMIADAARYVRGLRDARHLRSLFEIKTVLVRNESDDGRPILFRQESERPNVLSILGGKIDNVYDVFEALDRHLAGGARTAMRSEPFLSA